MTREIRKKRSGPLRNYWRLPLLDWCLHLEFLILAKRQKIGAASRAPSLHFRPSLFMKLRRKLSWMSALLGVLLLAGCAAPQVQDSPENIVRQRAKARWDALMAGDTEKAYQFLQPAYRAVRDLKFYQKSTSLGAAQWTGVDVVGVECKADVCSARIRIDYKVAVGMLSGGAFNTHYDEQWIMEKGSWWLYQRP